MKTHTITNKQGEQCVIAEHLVCFKVVEGPDWTFGRQYLTFDDAVNACSNPPTPRPSYAGRRETMNYLRSRRR